MKPHFSVTAPLTAESAPAMAGAPSDRNSSPALADLVLAAARHLEAALAEPLEAFQLTGTRYLVLEELSRAEGQCSQSELARRLVQSESNLSTVIERMRGEGLIERERSARDRRKSVLRLIPAGQRLLEQSRRVRGVVLQRLEAEIPSEQRASLRSALQNWLRFFSRNSRQEAGTIRGELPVAGQPEATSSAVSVPSASLTGGAA